MIQVTDPSTSYMQTLTIITKGSEHEAILSIRFHFLQDWYDHVETWSLTSFFIHTNLYQT
jgi:hypothetical protein